jgi:hypothetical protein
MLKCTIPFYIYILYNKYKVYGESVVILYKVNKE